MIKENLALCQQRLKIAAAQAGRLGEEITVVAVIKAVPISLVYEAIDAGIGHLGENRVQEALLRYESLNAYAHKSGQRLSWHMVGHLQTNKVKEAVKIFDLIHSVDSIDVAVEIDKQAARLHKIQNVLIQVNTSYEAAKFGFTLETVEEAVKEISVFKNTHMKGLMTIAPLVDNLEEARIFFRRLKELKDKINQSGNSPLTILSMGMTDDFEVAVEEGANMVRIGRGLFAGL